MSVPFKEEVTRHPKLFALCSAENVLLKRVLGPKDPPTAEGTVLHLAPTPALGLEVVPASPSAEPPPLPEIGVKPT